jgi:YD repeat-containing protein
MKIIYYYDALDRLVEVVWEDGHRETYAYDAAGNRLSVHRPDFIQPLEVAPTPASTPLAHSALQTPSPKFNEEVPPIPVASSSPSRSTLIASVPVSFEIIVLNGALENQHFTLGDRLSLGREADNDLVLLDQKASRHHAVLNRQGVAYQIIDLNSSNGTHVNGQRIVQPTTLKNGDILLIGDTRLNISDRT